jgi:hypothetical protein
MVAEASRLARRKFFQTRKTTKPQKREPFGRRGGSGDTRLLKAHAGLTLTNSYLAAPIEMEPEGSPPLGREEEERAFAVGWSDLMPVMRNPVHPSSLAFISRLQEAPPLELITSILAEVPLFQGIPRTATRLDSQDGELHHWQSLLESAFHWMTANEEGIEVPIHPRLASVALLKHLSELIRQKRRSNAVQGNISVLEKPMEIDTLLTNEEQQEFKRRRGATSRPPQSFQKGVKSTGGGGGGGFNGSGGGSGGKGKGRGARGKGGRGKGF